MARYLITGGAGFIGSHLCDRLIERGDELVVVDDMSSGSRGNLAHLADRVDLVEGDINSGVLDDDFGRIDAVVHLAALISGYDSLNEPDAYMATNMSGLLRVVDMAVRHRVPRIVFASSSTVYGNGDTDEFSERNLPAPITVYAATKLAGEHLLHMYGKLHGFSHCSLRFFNVYGPRQSVDHPYANVTCKFSDAAANERPIKLFGDGRQTRDFVFVDDVVRSILLVLGGSPSSVYNIGTGEQTSIGDLISTLEALSGNSLMIDRQPEWPNDIRRIAADISLAGAELDYRPTVGIREGLERTVAFFAGR